MTEDVSIVAAECIFSEVEGEDVEMERGVGIVACFVLLAEGVECFEGVCVCTVDAGEEAKERKRSGFCCVWIRVFTTSSGHVIMPARQPAEAPVMISRGRPMSRRPT